MNNFDKIAVFMEKEQALATVRHNALMDMVRQMRTEAVNGGTSAVQMELPLGTAEESISSSVESGLKKETAAKKADTVVKLVEKEESVSDLIDLSADSVEETDLVKEADVVEETTIRKAAPKKSKHTLAQLQKLISSIFVDLPPAVNEDAQRRLKGVHEQYGVTTVSKLDPSKIDEFYNKVEIILTVVEAAKQSTMSKEDFKAVVIEFIENVDPDGTAMKEICAQFKVERPGEVAASDYQRFVSILEAKKESMSKKKTASDMF